MAFTHQESGFDHASTGTQASVTLSAAPSSGELVVMYMTMNSSGPTITADSGGATWTEALNAVPTGKSAQHALWWKIANASESATMSSSWSGNVQWTCTVRVFSSIDDAVVDAAINTADFSTSSTDLTLNAADGEVISDDALSLIFGGKDGRAGDEAYTTADNSYTGVLGNVDHQATGSAYRIYTTGTTFSGNVVLETADSNDGLNESAFSAHISFTDPGETGGGISVPVAYMHLRQQGIG